MTFSDTLVKSREALLAGLLRIDREKVLNPIQNGKTEVVRGEEAAFPVTAKIKNALFTIKATAMDEGGAHVNYTQILKSQYYQR